MQAFGPTANIRRQKTSYNKNNGYSYNTFLAYQNVGFKNNQYVFMNETDELQNHLKVIVTHFREKFNFQK